MLAAPKQEVMRYLDQMDENNVLRVLLYAKSLSSNKQQPQKISLWKVQDCIGVCSGTEIVE